jgi:hypothetical protein
VKKCEKKREKMSPKMTQNGPKTRKNAKNDDFLTFFTIFCEKMSKKSEKKHEKCSDLHRTPKKREKNVKKNDFYRKIPM